MYGLLALPLVWRGRVDLLLDRVSIPDPDEILDVLSSFGVFS